MGGLCEVFVTSLGYDLDSKDSDQEVIGGMVIYGRSAPLVYRLVVAADKLPIDLLRIETKA